MHVWKTCTGPVLVFIFVIEISNHLCCLLHLHQTSIVGMVVTTASDQQACILQFLLSSRNVFNGYTQPAVMMVINICSMQIYLLLVGLLTHCTPLVNSISLFFLVILFFSNPSLNYFQADFFLCILIKKRCVLWASTLSQSFRWYRSFSIPWHLSLHYFSTKCLPKVGTFMWITWY